MWNSLHWCDSALWKKREEITETTSGSLFSLLFLREHLPPPNRALLDSILSYYQPNDRDRRSRKERTSSFSRRQLKHKKNKEFSSVPWKSLAESHQLSPCCAEPFDGQADMQGLSVNVKKISSLLSFTFCGDLTAEKLLWALTLIRARWFCCNMHQHNTKP